MKRLLTIILTLFIALGISCSTGDKSAVEGRLNETITSIKEKEFKNISDVVGSSGAGTPSIKFSSKATAKIKIINKDVTLSVNSIEVTGEEAIANVTVKSCDLAKIVVDSLDKALMASLLTVSTSSAEDRFNEQFENELEKIQTNEKTGDIKLKKVNGEWELKDKNELLHLFVGEP